jgi:hypothetical protein
MSSANGGASGGGNRLSTGTIGSGNRSGRGNGVDGIFGSGGRGVVVGGGASGSGNRTGIYVGSGGAAREAHHRLGVFLLGTRMGRAGARAIATWNDVLDRAGVAAARLLAGGARSARAGVVIGSGCAPRGGGAGPTGTRSGPGLGNGNRKGVTTGGGG